jgi:hypothetical protein
MLNFVPGAFINAILVDSPEGWAVPAPLVAPVVLI